jgi:hypothetical protein
MTSFLSLRVLKINEINLHIDLLLNQYNNDRRINISPEGYGIVSCLRASPLFKNTYQWSFNSFSEILDVNWLDKLLRHASPKGSIWFLRPDLGKDNVQIL